MNKKTKGNAFLYIGGAITLVMTVLILVGLVWTPYSPTEMDPSAMTSPPSLAHLLGTDNFGRDIFSRVLEGAGTSFLIAVCVVAIGCAAGTLMGALCGYYGGIPDLVAHPGCATPSPPFPAFSWPWSSSVWRARGPIMWSWPWASSLSPALPGWSGGEFARCRDLNYIRSARLMGVGDGRILFCHILPNTRAVLLPAITIGFNNAILSEASMSYLGIGIQPPQASLGSMLSDSQTYLGSAPWYALSVGGTMVLMILGFSLLSEGLQQRGPQELREGSDMAELLSVRDLRVRFHRAPPGRYAVDGVSFSLEEGEILGLVGESGSGKTVTAMTVSGLLPRRQTQVSGSVILAGREILGSSEAQLRALQGSDLAVVFQEPMTSLNPCSASAPRWRRACASTLASPLGERRQRALEAMAQAELPDRRPCTEVSPRALRGMLQRVMIAAAIVSRPKLLLADEPTTALDVTIQAQILALLKKLSLENHMAILFISHDLNVVRRLCRRVAVMQRGRLVETGTAEELFRAPREDYTRQLIAAIPTRDRRLDV